MKGITTALMAIAACIVLSAGSLSAQRTSSLRVGLKSAPAANLSHHRVSIQTSVRRTHWKEGAVIGAIPGFITGYLVIHTLSDGDTPESIGAGLLFGAATGIIGALIGGQFPKSGGRDAAGDPPEIGT